MYHCLGLARTDGLEECVTSIFMVERFCELGIMLEVTTRLNHIVKKLFNYMRKQGRRVGYMRDGWRKGDIGYVEDSRIGSSLPNEV
jgi:hypothetical protein